MQSAIYDLVIISDNRLMAEAIGVALVAQGVIDTWLQVCPGREIPPLQAMPKPPAVIVVDERSHTDSASLNMRIQRLRQEFPGSQMVVIGDGVSLDRITDCILSGASSFVLVSDCLAELSATISALTAGEARCSKVVIETILRKIRDLSAVKRQEAGCDENTLTHREIEVLELVEKGMLNKEIGGRLGIAGSTVKNHLHSIFEKLNVTERRQAVRRGFAIGILNGQRQDAVA